MADRKTDMEHGSAPGISPGADSLLRASLDHIRHGVLIYDRDLIIVAINNRARDILRLSDTLLKVGDPFEKYVRIISKRGGYGDSGTVEERVMARMTYAKTFAPYRVEQKTIHGDNVEVFGQPVEGAGYVTTYTDITSRVQAEHSVRRNEQRVLDFAEASSDWFWETDSTHCYSYLSDGFEVRTGFKHVDWIGKNRYEQLAHSQQQASIRHEHKAVLDARDTFRDLVYSFARPDGQVMWISVSGRPVYDDNQLFAGYRGTSRDITRQMELQASLRETSQREQSANRAKSEFLSSMSHELRTPLNAIIGFGQLLDMDQEDPLSDNQKIAVREILRGGNHLVSLVDQVLDLSGIESGNLPMAIRAVESRPVVDECIALISGAARDRGLTLHVVGQTVEYMVKADPVRLKQVLLNLLMNAVKYNTTGKKVGLELARSGDTQLRFSISDDGPGIPLERQDALFKPFDRLGMEARDIEGTGIGLTISRDLVELMEGKIGFRNAAGNGAIFWFELPLWDPASPTI